MGYVNLNLHCKFCVNLNLHIFPLELGFCKFKFTFLELGLRSWKKAGIGNIILPGAGTLNELGAGTRGAGFRSWNEGAGKELGIC